jgi:proton-translocating NADH-quinone oxidoreductase chain M
MLLERIQQQFAGWTINSKCLLLVWGVVLIKVASLLGTSWGPLPIKDVMVTLLVLTAFTFFYVMCLSGSGLSVTLNLSGLLFLLSLFLLNGSISAEYTLLRFEEWGIALNLWCDGISVFFIILTTFLTFICVLVSGYSVTYRLKELLLAFIGLEFFLLLAFSADDLFLFYLAFEGILIPMYFMIGVWGSRERRVVASYYLFFYTLVGSLLFLLGILYVQALCGSTQYGVVAAALLKSDQQYLLWWLFFFAFAVKVPMYPFHIWLPEAHVEAPTGGSIILAGVLLKLGGYGFLRFLIPWFPLATQAFLPFVYTLAILGIIKGALSALCQVDLKRIIAYSSVVHMNIIVLGLFSLHPLGLAGGYLLMLAHGLIASALFALVGILYYQYGTRLLYYFGGLNVVMPQFCAFFFFFAISNFTFPLTANFIGEVLTIFGLASVIRLLLVFPFFGSLITLGYTILLYNRVANGVLKVDYISTFSDLRLVDFWVLSSFLYPSLLLTFYPNFVFSRIIVDIYAICGKAWSASGWVPPCFSCCG